MAPSDFPAHGAAVVVGIVLCGIALYKGWRCWSPRSWPTVPGEVIYSDTEDQLTQDDGDTTTVRYRAWVRYRYAVKGKQYTVTLASIVVLAAGIALIAWGCGISSLPPGGGSSGMQ